MITVLAVVATMAIVLYLFNRYVPVEPPARTVINIVAVVGLLIWLVFALVA